MESFESSVAICRVFARELCGRCGNLLLVGSADGRRLRGNGRRVGGACLCVAHFTPAPLTTFPFRAALANVHNRVNLPEVLAAMRETLGAPQTVRTLSSQDANGVRFCRGWWRLAVRAGEVLGLRRERRRRLKSAA